MLVTELFIDLFFLCDIILNFNTGFIADQVLAVKPFEVAMRQSAICNTIR